MIGGPYMPVMPPSTPPTIPVSGPTTRSCVSVTRKLGRRYISAAMISSMMPRTVNSTFSGNRISACAEKKMVTTSVTTISQNCCSALPARPPSKNCTRLVTRMGAVISATAVLSGTAKHSSGIEISGRPRPTMPLMKPPENRQKAM